MKTIIIAAIIIGIGIVIFVSGFTYQETYNQNCIEDDGKVTGFLKCTRVFVFPEDPNAELKQKIQKLIDEEKKNPTRAGHSFVSIAINSDELTHDEKLQAIEIHTKEGSGKPNTSNVLTGKNLFEDQESITFTWKQYGWGTPCPKIAIQDELRVDQYNREVIYQEEKQSLCPVFLEDSAFFFTFTEEDFPNFPPCSITGQHYISVRNQFDDWFTLHEYWCDSAAFLAEYPQIRQNDMYCWTQWYMKNTTIDEEKLILSIQSTISEFGSHVDVPEREITVSYNEEETVISIAGIWTEDQNQHKELTSVVKNHIGDSKIIRDDIIMCA